jgi:hypothetical protein
MTEKSPAFLFILTASLLNNLIIPFVIYFKKYGLFKKRNKNFIGCNAWGIIMDGFLAGLINITALNFLLALKPKILLDDIKIALFMGLASMIFAHLWMSARRWKIWVMPQPWHWNSAGYWHMVSMTIQMSFLFYPLVIILKNPPLLAEPITKPSIIFISLLTLLFLLAFHLSNKGLKIGRFHLNKEPW